MKIRASKMNWSDSIELSGIVQSGLKRSIARELIFEDIEEEEIMSSFISLDKTASQVLMDDLWDCGIRPSEGSGSAGSMAAIKYHLEDIRKLLFHKEKIK